MRIVRGSPATLSTTFTVDDNPTDLDGPPTVVVTRADRSVVSTGAGTRTDVGAYTYALPAQATLAVLTAEWTGALNGSPVMSQTYAEVVGAEYFSLKELRTFDQVLANITKYPDAKLRAARLSTAAEFEGICGRSFVPRYAREILVGDGNCVVWLSNPDPIRLISCTVNGEDWSNMDLRRPSDNLRTLMLNQGTFPLDGRIVLEYEYGMLEPPVRIKRAALKRAKYDLVSDNARIDERATTMNIPDFGNFVLSTPGIRGSLTGIPEVDVVLQDYML